MTTPTHTDPAGEPGRPEGNSGGADVDAGESSEGLTQSAAAARASSPSDDGRSDGASSTANGADGHGGAFGGEPSLASSPDERTYMVELPNFEGPLDLLLHLVRRHELDILDIPIAFVCEKYLAYLAFMRAMDLEVAGDYLVMAATLAFLKSRELVPSEPEAAEEGEHGEDGPDPREELIARLLEYQKYREAAKELDELPVSGRDVFERGGAVELPPVDPGLAPITLFRLAEAFHRVLDRARIHKSHEVVMETVSVAQRMGQLTSILAEKPEFDFESLFLDRTWSSEGELRSMLVVTLMSILELTKLGIIKVHQPSHTQTIRIARLATPEKARELLCAYDEAASFGSGPSEDDEQGDDAKKDEPPPVAAGPAPKGPLGGPLDELDAILARAEAVLPTRGADESGAQESTAVVDVDASVEDGAEASSEVAEDLDAKSEELEASAEDLDEAPTDHVEAAAEELEAPAEDLEAPTDHVEATAEELETPAEDLEAPTDHVEATAEELEATAQELEAPAEDVEAKVEEPEASADDLVEATADEFETPAEDLEAPIDHVEATAEDELETPAGEFEATAEELEASPEESKAEAEELDAAAEVFEAKSEGLEAAAEEFEAKSEGLETPAADLDPTAADFEATTEGSESEGEPKTEEFEAPIEETEELETPVEDLGAKPEEFETPVADVTSVDPLPEPLPVPTPTIRPTSWNPKSKPRARPKGWPERMLEIAAALALTPKDPGSRDLAADGRGRGSLPTPPGDAPKPREAASEAPPGVQRATETPQVTEGAVVGDDAPASSEDEEP